MKKVLILALILSLLSGCSSSYETSSNYSAPEMSKEESKEIEYVSEDKESSSDTGSSLEISNYSEKIAYTIDLSLETKDFDQNILDITDLLEKYEGFIENSSISGKTRRSAYYNLKIPTKNYLLFLDEIKETGNVYNIDTFAENLTSEYFDTKSRLNTLEIEETRLLELLEIAENIDDIIALEERLSQIRYEIESLTTSINVMDFRVDYTSINIDIDEVIDYEETNNFLDNLVGTFRNSGSQFIRSLEYTLYSFIYAAPFLIFWAIIIFVVIRFTPIKKLIKKIKNIRFKK